MRAQERIITLEGMSGTGKSHWSLELEKAGFQRFCCDDLIEDRLGKELQALGYSGGIQDVARWMGQPYDSRYKDTSRRYLELEGEVVSNVLEEISDSGTRKNIVIDTTGSVIYLEEGILRDLSERTRVVYLETPPEVKDRMLALYLADPKPVIWGHSFIPENGETDREALGRCYPNLLAYRTGRYQRLADVMLDYHQLHRPGFTVNDFLHAALQ